MVRPRMLMLLRRTCAGTVAKFSTTSLGTVADRKRKERICASVMSSAHERMIKRFANVSALLVNIENTFERGLANQICSARHE